MTRIGVKSIRRYDEESTAQKREREWKLFYRARYMMMKIVDETTKPFILSLTISSYYFKCH